MSLDLKLNEQRYVSILSKLVGETEYLQNCPPNHVPQEDRAVKHLLAILQPHTKEHGGLLTVEHISYVEGRGNLIVEYAPEGASGSLAFIGSHFDVVPANPDSWQRYPFRLTREGDRLYGRGTTDCLGHVALLTELFLQLADKKPPLKFAVTSVFIANEENASIPNVGVDMLMRYGKLDHLRQGPLFWVDSSDIHPRIGTASVIVWKLTASGKSVHSSLPHLGINSLEVAMEATTYVQKRFYEDFPSHPREKDYRYATPSTMKPTQICCSKGNVSQIPEWTEVRGDVRLTPFYSIDDCKMKIAAYLNELNRDLSRLQTRGPCSKYNLKSKDGSDCSAQLSIEFEGQPYRGIACNLESPGFRYLHEATKEVFGDSTPFSICGSLPLIGDLKEKGFDVQICGYGHSSVYHGDNEYCTLKDMETGFKILCSVLSKFNSSFE